VVRGADDIVSRSTHRGRLQGGLETLSYRFYVTIKMFRVLPQFSTPCRRPAAAAALGVHAGGGRTAIFKLQSSVTRRNAVEFEYF
jgi:hypothetical protein